MQCDIFSAGEKVGFLRSERQGLYTRFYGEVDTKAVTRVYGVFEGGECALGVPVPERGKMVLRGSMPTAKLPKGKLLSGRLPSPENGWSRFSGEVLGGVTYPEGIRKENTLRFRWASGQPFPADEVLLFFRPVREDGRDYLQLKLREDGTVLLED